MQKQLQYQNRLRNGVIIIAGTVIILTWLRYAQDLVVPFLLSVFIAIIAAVPVGWLKKRGVPVLWSILLVLLVITVLEVLLAMLLGSSVEQFSQSLPTYQARLQEMSSGVLTWLTQKGIDVSESGILQVLDPGAVMQFANSLISGLGSTLSNIFLIMFTVMFMLLEAWTIPAKFKSMNSERSALIQSRIADVIQSTKEYTAIKALMSLITGGLVWAGLSLVGVDFAALWGFLAFMLNFIPTIGSIIAAIPAVLLALVQLGPMSALIVIIIYLAANTLIGNIVEPKFMGEKVGLSTLVVFLSMVFWGWLLGPVGMLLSVPLTMIVKFAALSSDETRWLAVMLGPEMETADESLPAESKKKITK